MKFSGKVGNGPVIRLLNFGGNLDHGYQSPDHGYGYRSISVSRHW